MNFKFEKLIVWQKSMDFGEEINRVAYNFPEIEKFNLSSQIRRAVDSVALNISEGSIGQSNAENMKFISYSIRSLAEVVTCLHKANKREYISKEKFNVLYKTSFNLMNMLIAYKKSLKMG
ncbi:MAG: four helix bundle protein [Candidatus Cloacimonadota bacterium]|nr:MAG: four helix bundle protein [Candidatus Cloacimonadota bacterium]PIE77388.1 MAG: four helix bundle protein [Candidatus Delongbacteria bacterium]